jgi:hypothetical protein
MLTALRKDLRDSTGAATQFGYGPRYLHSTGQLHKGGANRGVFIMITHRTEKDEPIPGSAFSFSELERSQAFGDMEALDSKGCRVALVDLKDSSKESIKELGSFIKAHKERGKRPQRALSFSKEAFYADRHRGPGAHGHEHGQKA